MNAWTAAKIVFWGVCVVGSLWLAIWALACIVSAQVLAHQQGVQKRRRAHNHRVGGSITP